MMWQEKKTIPKLQLKKINVKKRNEERALRASAGFDQNGCPGLFMYLSLFGGHSH